ncbi:hypothetical protein DL89DRAFT_264816, partial [Linderina pennispora]
MTAPGGWLMAITSLCCVLSRRLKVRACAMRICAPRQVSNRQTSRTDQCSRAHRAEMKCAIAPEQKARQLRASVRNYKV